MRMTFMIKYLKWEPDFHKLTAVNLKLQILKAPPKREFTRQRLQGVWWK